MRNPGREFGSDKPLVIYVALRWNDHFPLIHQEEAMINSIARKLIVPPMDLRIYNLVRPEKDRKMSLGVDEFEDVKETINRIILMVNNCHTVQRIVVGGKSAPMQVVAMWLKFLLPKIPVEVRNHHKARSVNGPPLGLVKVI